MDNLFTYKGYIGKVVIDPENNTLYGSVINTRDIITFTADTVSELHQAFQDSVEDYLTWAQEDGFEPEKPYSGKIILRMSPDLHRQISTHAALEGISINQFITNTLEKKFE